MSKPIFIAEIKTQSPFGFQSPHPFAALMNYAITYGDWVSVHTNALWGGDFEALSFVRRNTTKPILAKGFHTTDDDIQRALDHGADYVLVVDRIPSPMDIRLGACLFEISYNDALHFKSVFPGMRIVCNSRDLKTGLPKKQWELDKYLDTGLWVCQASGIRSMADVDPNVQAFIVGERLVEFCKALPCD